MSDAIKETQQIKIITDLFRVSDLISEGVIPFSGKAFFKEAESINSSVL